MGYVDYSKVNYCARCKLPTEDKTQLRCAKCNGGVRTSGRLTSEATARRKEKKRREKAKLKENKK